MRYYSTNRKALPVSFRHAVLKGLAEDGGLYMPERIPAIDFPSGTAFQEISYEVVKCFAEPEVPGSVLRGMIDEAINFDAPLRKLSDQIYVLELFHGPTLAFKDFGARVMARLMSYFVRGLNRELTVLVATSGDTGSAVAHGFLRASGIRVILLYPAGKVSLIQEKQLTTLGENVVALEIGGTFDDCQALVKQAFCDLELHRSVQLTSANSINIARLIPQCFYYWYAMAQLEADPGSVFISVPSGNFGNLTAGLIAKRMGLPAAGLLAACNSNSVVPQYLASGKFEPRPSVQTLSNAMDVGNPSNFARMLALYDHDVYKMRKDVYASSFSDTETRAAIREIFKRYGYVADPHGAIGYLGLKKFMENQLAGARGIFLETAHPAKFADVVEEVLGQTVEIPERLKECLGKEKKAVPLSNRYDEFRSFLLSY